MELAEHSLIFDGMLKTGVMMWVDDLFDLLSKIALTNLLAGGFWG
jgi:hypothetical protein